MEFKRLKEEDQSAGEVEVENLSMPLNPLLMEHTLTRILQDFQRDGSFFKSIRFLSKLWNLVALKQFLKSNFFRIPPKFNSDFPSQQEKDAALFKIKQMLEKIGTLKNISINEDFSTDMKIFQSLEPQIQWEKITQLRIHFQFSPSLENIQGRTKFMSEIMTKCPHLKFLDIPPQSNHTFSQEIGFTFMKFCVALNKNQNLSISNLAAIVSTKQDAEIVIQFSETGVRVLNFLAKPLYPLKRNFPLQIPAVIKAFEKIIESNKNHLISFGLNDRDAILLPGFEIPEKIPQLEIWHLAAERISKLKFKDGFQFHTNFPNLYQVNLHLSGLVWYGRNPFWANLFQNQKPCPTVKKLKVQSLDKLEEEIFQIFPQVQELSFCGRVVLTSPEIFKFLKRNCGKLRILQLEVPDNKFEKQMRFVSNISGFSMDVVRILMTRQTNLNLTCTATTDNEKGINGSFLRVPALEILKNLEQLDLICNEEAELAAFCDKYMEFLQKHVFSSVPKLKVKCRKVGIFK